MRYKLIIIALIAATMASNPVVQQKGDESDNGGIQKPHDGLDTITWSKDMDGLELLDLLEGEEEVVDSLLSTNDMETDDMLDVGGGHHPPPYTLGQPSAWKHFL